MGTFDEDDIDNDDDDSFWRVSNEKLRAQNAKDVGENQNDGLSESRQRRCRLCLAGKNENARFTFQNYMKHKLFVHYFYTQSPRM